MYYMNFKTFVAYPSNVQVLTRSNTSVNVIWSIPNEFTSSIIKYRSVEQVLCLKLIHFLSYKHNSEQYVTPHDHLYPFKLKTVVCSISFSTTYILTLITLAVWKPSIRMELRMPMPVQ